VGDRGFETQRLAWQDDQLARIALPGGALCVTRGLGSGLARCRSDAPDLFWAIGDRGPNLKVKVAVRRYGLESLRPLKDVDGAKIMPCLDYGPALAQLRLGRDAVTLVRALPLRGSDGRMLSGLPPPASPHAEHEPIFSLDGERLGTDPSGVDSEGLAALADGGFWVGDEYGPSLLKVDRDGTVIIRWVPAGTESFFAGAAYPVAPVLPAIASARRLNRGFEALALSPDETSLYVIFQSPLAHPDRAAHQRSRHVRIWRLDAASGALLAEYLYELDPPSAFRRDLSLGKVEGSDIKICEAILLGDNHLLLLERVSASTRLYSVDLLPRCLLAPEYADPGERPTIEQMDAEGLTAAGIAPLPKTLVLDTDLAPEICGDLEGLILLSPRALLLVNDNDFGVEGVGTQFWRVTLDKDLG
jgi:hypothetical protein